MWEIRIPNSLGESITFYFLCEKILNPVQLSLWMGLSREVFTEEASEIVLYRSICILSWYEVGLML